MGEIACLDCGTKNMPVDTVLTVKQWEIICPEDGVLCATCIVRRASKLPTVLDVCMRIIFLDDVPDDDLPGGKFWRMMKALDSC